MPVIRRQSQVFNRPIGVVRVDSGEQQTWEKVAGIADSITQYAFGELEKNAKETGRDLAMAVNQSNLTTINPETGQPEAFRVPEGLGRVGAEVYNSIIEKRFQNSIDQEIKGKSAEFALKFPDPEQYGTEFAQYIGSMTKYAQGSAKGYIEAAGASYLQSTKLNLTAKAQERHLQTLGAESLNSAEEQIKLINSNVMASNGSPQSIAAAMQTLEGIRDDVANHERMYALKPGASQDVYRKGLTRLGVSVVQAKMSQLPDDSIEKVALAIKSNGAYGALNKEEREVFNAYTEIVGNSPSEIQSGAQDILSAGNAILAARKLDRDANIGTQKFDFVSEFPIHLESNYQIGLSYQDSPDAIQSIRDNNSSYYNQLRKLVADEVITPAAAAQQYSEFKEAAWTGLVRSAGVGLDAAGLEQLEAALREGNPSLAPKGKEDAVADIMEFISVADHGTLNTQIGQLKDAANITGKLQRDTATIEASETLQQLGGTLRNKTVDEAKNIINKYKEGLQGKGIPPKTLSGYSRNANEFLANRIIGQVFDPNIIGKAPLTKEHFLSMSAYVSGDAVQLPTPIKEIIDDAMQYATPEHVSAHLRKLATEQGQLQAAESKRVLENRVRSEVFDQNAIKTKQHRDVLDLQIGAKLDGQSPAEFFMSEQSFSGQHPAMKVFAAGVTAGTIPTSFIDLTQKAVNGLLPSDKAGFILNHVENLSNFRTNDGRVVNLLTSMGGMSEERFGKLKAMIEVAKFQGTNDYAQIAQTRREFEESPGAKADMRENFGKSGIDYIAKQSEFKDAINNPRMMDALAPLAEHLWMLGVRDTDKINDVLEEYKDKRFIDTDGYVKDLRNLDSDKSEYALHAVFPDDSVRDFFISHVQNYLPNGYVFGKKGLETFEAAGRVIPPSEVDDAGFKEVFLVPEPTNRPGVVFYIPYTLGNIGQPELVKGKNGELLIFSPIEKEVVNFRVQERARKEAEEMSAAQALDVKIRQNQKNQLIQEAEMNNFREKLGFK